MYKTFGVRKQYCSEVRKLDKHTDTQTYKHTDKHTHTNTHTHTYTHTHTQQKQKGKKQPNLVSNIKTKKTLIKTIFYQKVQLVQAQDPTRELQE